MTVSWTASGTSAAPPEDVWDLLVDLDGHARWNTTLVRIEGQVAVGERVELVAHTAPKRTFRPTVREVDAPRRMVWSDGMPLGLFTGTRTYELVPDGTGTSISVTEEFRGPLSTLVARATPDLEPSLEQFVADLARAAEGTTTD